MNETMIGAVIIDPLNGKMGIDHLQEGEIVIRDYSDIFDDDYTFTKSICDECNAILHNGIAIMVKAYEATSIEFNNLDDLKTFLITTPFTLIYKIIKRKDTGHYMLRYFPQVGYTSLEHYQAEEFTGKIINEYKAILPKNIRNEYSEELLNLLTSHLSKRFGDK